MENAVLKATGLVKNYGGTRALDGLEGMYKSGLRYPIGSYSLTTDIIAGLPPHYMDY